MKLFLFFRSLCFSPLFLIWTVFLTFVFLLSNFFFSKTSFADWILRWFWYRPFQFLFSQKVIVLGKENFNLVSGGLVLFNHTSYLDIPVLASYFPVGVRFGAKAELFRIPVFGKAMRLAGNLEIHRKNAKKTLMVYEQARERLKKGCFFALSPEGGRKEKEDVFPFKFGPFVFASQAQAFIYPVVLCGVRNFLPKGEWKMGYQSFCSTIYVSILSPIDSSKFDPNNLTELKEKVKEVMHQELIRLQALQGDPAETSVGC